MKNELSKTEQPCTIHSVVWRVLFIIANACVAGVIASFFTSISHCASVLFIVGWVSHMIWYRIFS
jgi:hypothetical protein